jgi:hypothetical protein
MECTGHALPDPIECIIKWWLSFMMNVRNKGYSLGVNGKRWVQQAALNHQYLPTKLHCVYHGRLKSERTLYHISITCGIAPSHVGRISFSGMCCREPRWVLLPEVLKQCSALDMSRPTCRMNITSHHSWLAFSQHSCESLRSHKSALPCMCWSP